MVRQVVNIFITVGTTAFDSLFRVLDYPIIQNRHNFKAQIGPGKYIPTHMPHFKFTDEIGKFIDWADAVICHAGAGTVFSLLEQEKRCLVVANTERTDQHQLELARYVSDNGYALTTQDVKNVPTLLDKLFDYKPNRYEKTPFFKSEEITNLILERY